MCGRRSKRASAPASGGRSSASGLPVARSRAPGGTTGSELSGHVSRSRRLQRGRAGRRSGGRRQRARLRPHQLRKRERGDALRRSSSTRLRDSSLCSPRSSARSPVETCSSSRPDIARDRQARTRVVDRSARETLEARASLGLIALAAVGPPVRRTGACVIESCGAFRLARLRRSAQFTRHLRGISYLSRSGNRRPVGARMRPSDEVIRAAAS